MPRDDPAYPVAERIARDPDFADPGKRMAIAERELAVHAEPEPEIEVILEPEIEAALLALKVTFTV